MQCEQGSGSWYETCFDPWRVMFFLCNTSQRLLLAALVAGNVAGCKGLLEPEVPSSEAQVGGGGGQVPQDPDLEPGTSLGRAPVRRMTRFEYNNTVRDLLGDTTLPARDFGEEEETNGFNNNAQSLVTTSALADKYLRAAEGIAERATVDLGALSDCDLSQAACADAFVAKFLQQAFRRPATDTELAAFAELYQTGLAESPRIAVSLVITAALQSPAFLYRLEFAGHVPATTRIGKLDGFELASRLSYLLWGSLPDAELLEVAAQGRLVTKADVEREARRMLNDPRARDVVAEFHRQWLDYERVLNVGKDQQLFAGWSGDLANAMVEETRAYIDGVVFDGQGTLDALLTAPSVPAQELLVSYYGATERRGLLTQGSLLSYNAHSNQTSPVHRGQLVRKEFLCDVVPPPPADVAIVVPEPDPNSTTRERLAMHAADPSCAGCHELMDPIGLGFERYDGAGRFRTDEAGSPVDASGELTGTDVDGAFDGVDELSGKLAASEKVSRCYVRQWFRFGYGREASVEDKSTLDALGRSFAASGENIQELLVALTQTDAFMARSLKAQPTSEEQP